MGTDRTDKTPAPAPAPASVLMRGWACGTCGGGGIASDGSTCPTCDGHGHTP